MSVLPPLPLPLPLPLPPRGLLPPRGALKPLVDGLTGDCVGGRIGTLPDAVVAVVVVVVVGVVEIVTAVVVIDVVVDVAVELDAAAVAVFGVDVIGVGLDDAAGGVCGGVATIPKRKPLASRASWSLRLLSSFAALLLSSSPRSDRPLRP